MNVHLRPNRSAIAAAEQQQAAEGERVRGDDPLPLVVGEAEVGLGGRERDVHDRHVQHHQQLGDADDGEDQPPAVVMGIWKTWGGPPRRVESRSPVKVSQVETSISTL